MQLLCADNYSQIQQVQSGHVIQCILTYSYCQPADDLLYAFCPQINHAIILPRLCHLLFVVCDSHCAYAVLEIINDHHQGTCIGACLGAQASGPLCNQSIIVLNHLHVLLIKHLKLTIFWANRSSRRKEHVLHQLCFSCPQCQLYEHLIPPSGYVPDHLRSQTFARLIVMHIILLGSVTSFYGQGNMSILVSDFQCTGSEGNLAACNHTNTSIDTLIAQGS